MSSLILMLRVVEGRSPLSTAKDEMIRFDIMNIIKVIIPLVGILSIVIAVYLYGWLQKQVIRMLKWRIFQLEIQKGASYIFKEIIPWPDRFRE